MTSTQLIARQTKDGRVEEIDKGWRFTLNEGSSDRYRLGQLDNYSNKARRNFPHRPPFELRLRARASQKALPGTWGFGIWNDPFGFSLGLGGTAGRLPTLPNSAWFFFASRENYLSFCDDQDGNGQLVAVFRSPRIPAIGLAPTLLVLPLLAWPLGARWLRTRAANLIKQQSAALKIDATMWHDYWIDWQVDRVEFKVDGKLVLDSRLALAPPLGLVLWLDNQYAAWRPDGRISNGTLATPAECWVEITDLKVN